MAQQLSSFLTAPRSYSRYLRHRSFARLGGGANQFSAFLAAQATRLASTPSAVFTRLRKNTADRVRGAANTGQLS